MEENPYESPKDTGPSPYRIATGAGLALIASIPAACICGGITCYSVGVTGEVAASVFGYEGNAKFREMGWFVGIPIALLVVVLIPLVRFRRFVRKQP
jgi:hypothetical protein